MNDYEKMSKAELVQRLRALEQLDSQRRLTEAEEQVHLIQSVVEQGFSAVLITNADVPDPRSKRLEKEILEISDRERQRIGQDLHDGLCQHLAGIELMSQVLEQQLAPKSRATAARAGEIARHVREGISQTRSLARGLSPVTLESEGLMSALRELAASTERMFGVKCRFACDPPALVRDLAVATHLYRIAQEAVSNAIKHGEAREVGIHVQSVGSRTGLSVRDNGVGFPKSIPKEKGMGLRIMRSRAGMLGGSLSIEKDPAGGTVVVCSVPGGP